MKTLIYLFIIVIVNITSFGQTIEWAKRYDGPLHLQLADNPLKIACDNDGNVYVAGSVELTTLRSGYVTIKYNSTGDSVWVRTYFPNIPINVHSGAYSVEVDNSGNVYVSGEMSFGPSELDVDILTLKYSPAGVLLWENIWGSNQQDIGRDLVLSSDGYVYVSGTAGNVLTSSMDAVVVKINPTNGATIWAKQFTGGLGYTRNDPRYITADDNTNVYVTGYASLSNSIEDYLTAKISSTEFAPPVWIKTYDAVGLNDVSNSIYISPSNNVYVTGSSQGSTSGDIATIKYNSSGVQQWVTRYANGGGNSIKGDGQGNLYVGGVELGSTYVLKYDDSPNLIWGTSYYYRIKGAVVSMAIDNNNNIYAMGYCTPLGSSNSDFLIWSLEPNGIIRWGVQYDGPDGLNDGGIKGGITGRKIILDASNNVYVTGISNSLVGGEDFATLKISQSGSQNSPLQNSSINNNQLPSKFSLLQNYPNPFNPTTTFTFALPFAGNTKLTVYDMLGSEIEVVVNEYKQAGTYTVNFDAAKYSSGVYFYTLTSGSFKDTKKMTLVK